jgi:recA bacterial DNA recombination protein
MASLAAIRAQVEERLSGRVTAPFTARPPVEQPVLVTGIPAIDSNLGGIPCGEITEIVGARWASTGRKSLQSQLLSRATKDQFCALIDATDSFDPKSARTAGVDLRRLLWIRCSGQGIKAMEQAFKSADLLLQGSGGFGLLVLDLAGVSEKFVRKVPVSTWFRFRAVVEKLSAPLVVLTPYPVVGTCSNLTVNLSGAQIRWSRPTEAGPAHARLAMGLDFDVQVAARRSFKKPSQSIRSFSAERQWA